MRIRLERNGTAFEFERPPMLEHRFKALCLLAAGGMYARTLIDVLKLCGIFGMLWMFLFTIIMSGIFYLIKENLQ